MARKGHVGPRTFPASEEQGLVHLGVYITLHYITLQQADGMGARSGQEQEREQEMVRQRQRQRQPQALN